MTWSWMNDGVSAVVEEVRIAFTPTPGGTLVTLTHDLDEAAGDGKDLRQGWHDVLAGWPRRHAHELRRGRRCV